MQITNTPYSKAVSISLLVHIAMISLLLWLGQNTAAIMQPVEKIEVVPVELFNMDDRAAEKKIQPMMQQVDPIFQEHSGTSSANQFVRLPGRQQGFRENGGEINSGLQSIGGETSTELPAVIQSRSAGPIMKERDNPKREEVAVVPQKPTPVNVLRGASPKYPRSARQAGWEGIVVVRILVDTDGSPASLSIRSSSGYTVFDEAAIDAVRKWQFSPATKEGQPIAAYHDVKISFHLDDQE